MNEWSTKEYFIIHAFLSSLILILFSVNRFEKLHALRSSVINL